VLAAKFKKICGLRMEPQFAIDFQHFSALFQCWTTNLVCFACSKTNHL